MRTFFYHFILVLTCLVPVLAASDASAVYDPVLGRFVTRDVHPDVYPDGMNSYAPYHIVRQGMDPSGMDDIRTINGDRVYHVPEYATGWDRWDEATFIGWRGDDDRVTLHPKFRDKYGFPDARPRYSRVRSCGHHDSFSDVIPDLRRVARDTRRADNIKGAKRSERAGHVSNANTRDFVFQSENGRAEAEKWVGAGQDGGAVLVEKTVTEGSMSALPVGHVLRGGRAVVNTVRAGDGLLDDGVRAVRGAPVRLSPSVLAGSDDSVRLAASYIKPKAGYHDIIMHGTEDTLDVFHNGKWVTVSHRSLATFMKSNGYNGGPVRLIACGTGSKAGGVAQNLSNKLGAKVIAPSDDIHVFSDGAMIIGPTAEKNTGVWNTFNPGR